MVDCAKGDNHQSLQEQNGNCFVNTSSINICLHPLENFGCICASDFIDLKFKVGQFQIELGQKRTKMFQSIL